MQRVVWITKQYWLKQGPMTYMGLLNARAFAENDVVTDFFVCADAQHDPADTEQELSEFYGLQQHKNLTVHCINESKGSQRRVYKAAVAAIIAYCAKGEVLAVTREYGALTELLKLKKKCPGLKVLYETHNFFINLKHLDRRLFSLSRIRTQWVERNILPKADGLICLTEHQRALYQHWFPQLPAIALPLGCLDFPKYPEPEQRRLKRRIAYIGHLYSYKGLELFFELAKQLKPANIELHIFGGYEAEVITLRQRAEQEGLANVLFFKSFVEPKILHDILADEISIGLVPLQDTFYNRYLTCPVKVLDFAAHGLPIISSDLPSVRDILRDSGIYCDSQDAAEFAARAILLLDDADAYLRASQASYNRCRELLWRLRAQRILKFADEKKSAAAI